MACLQLPYVNRLQSYLKHPLSSTTKLLPPLFLSLGWNARNGDWILCYSKLCINRGVASRSSIEKEKEQKSEDLNSSPISAMACLQFLSVGLSLCGLWLHYKYTENVRVSNLKGSFHLWSVASCKCKSPLIS